MAKVYMVRNRDTGLYFKNGAKVAWTSTSAAKNAVINQGPYVYREDERKYGYRGWPKWENFEGKYQIVEVAEVEYE